MNESKMKTDSAFTLEPIPDQVSFVPLRHAVLARIRNAILEGLFSPGFVLSESNLAAQLNVSRTPVREALRVLEKEGVVALGRGRKMIVTTPTVKDIDEIYDIRLLVETEALRRFSPSDKHTIKKLEKCIASSTEDLNHTGSSALTDPQNDFHLVIISILNNRRLQEFVNSVYGLAISFRSMSMQEEGEAHAALQDHVKIFDYLMNNQLDEAINCLRDHLRIARENLKKKLRFPLS